jgi:DNA-directed RNA polymerase beta' subunit
MPPIKKLNNTPLIQKKTNVQENVQKQTKMVGPSGTFFDTNVFSTCNMKRAQDTTLSKDQRERMMAQNFISKEDLPSVLVNNIDIGVFNPEILRKIAVVNIIKADRDNIGSVNDPRMGGMNKACITCHNVCYGHLGMIEFNVPILHPFYISTIIKILQSVCNSCGGLILTEDEIKEQTQGLSGLDKLKVIASKSKDKTCRTDFGFLDQECNQNPEYLSETKNDWRIKYKRGKHGNIEYMDIDKIEVILKNISDEDAKLLGFNDIRPEWFILHLLPVIPPCDRVSLIQEGTDMPHDFTESYLNIVRINNEIGKIKNKVISDKVKISKKLTTPTLDELIQKLFFQVSHLIDNSDNINKRGNKVNKSLKEKINGKEGLIRLNLMGKRVNYAARTVAGPDPTLRVDQIRIPEVIAKSLTKREKVSSYNINYLNGLFKIGHITHLHPGQLGALKDFYGHTLAVDKKLIKIYDLYIGDEIDRWLQNGDYVIYNRQPTLSSHSKMGAEVVISSKFLTVGLPLAVTPALNADFDGDEINIHFPQSEEAQEEVRTLMNVKNCILDAQTNRNIIGLVMDAVSGWFRATASDVMVDKDLFFDARNLITKSRSEEDTAEYMGELYDFDERLKRRRVPEYSGRALFSLLLPNDFVYMEGNIIIKNGILISGQINKAAIGNAHQSIIQVLAKNYGIPRAALFITEGTWLMDLWLHENPMTIGLSDCIPPQGRDYVNKITEEAYARASRVVEAMGIPPENPLEKERYEKQIIAYVNTAVTIGTRLASELPINNNFRIMTESGAKGSVVNVAQVMGSLGQQFLEGKRMPLSIDFGRRCLPYFDIDTLDPRARGLCKSGLLEGLSPAESFVHQTAGREGLLDTAMKTSETGSIQRELIKFMESLIVGLDGTVRDLNDNIIQLSYGNDGFDSKYLENIKTPSGPQNSFINLKNIANMINSTYGF